MTSHINAKELLAWCIAALIWLLLAVKVASAQTPPPGRDNVVLDGYLSCPTEIEPKGACIFGLHYVTLTAGRTYEIRMESSDFYPRLILENVFGTQLAIDTDYFDHLSGAIVFRAPATDRYRLIANAVGPATGGYYTITVRELPTVVDVEDAVVAGGAVSRDVPLTAGRRYVIDLQSPRYDTFVRLLNANGVIVAFEDEGCMGNPARIVFTPARTETFRIVSAAAAPTESGPFRLTVCEQ